MAINIVLATQSVPDSFCPSNIQDDWPKLVALLTAQIPGTLNSFVMQHAIPDKEDEDKPWFRIGSDGSPDRWYAYANGAWISKHPLAPGAITLYMGNETSIKTYDGGEDSTPTLTSGWMWEKVAELTGKVPLGVGNLPAQGLDVAVGDTGGVDQHTLALTEDQLPSHTHRIGMEPGGSGLIGAAKSGFLRVGGGEEVSYLAGLTSIYGLTRSTGEGEDIIINNMVPYVGVYFIKRTLREWYRAT